MTIDSSLVAHLPLFAGLDIATCETILRDAHSLHVTKNKAVFEQGEEVHSFYLLLHGHIRAAKMTPAGEQVIVRYVSAGEIFGVAQAIGLATYPATAIAVEDSVILAWPVAAWARLTAEFPTLAANTLKTVGGRLQEAHSRVVEMSTEQVEQRVAHALLRLADQSGRKSDEGTAIDFPLSRQDIAEMTGATIFTVSRTLSSWEQRGLITSSRQRVVLRDPVALRILADTVPDDKDA
ncbi:Crp/Fnr family transcriptional regulator [Tardiphaga alba]|uniref:Crp/Fnr family transcriptional regulator n=1 Tax=Tardiphaga alba TaxID=340268 RepID=A0ABX8AE53_9BRAD|nr:Crp/Fnr family transcriptional regulator [Tardiphaga alba]QUS41572.1 Crp/Fnr family transcriptional regulator [Tardiphaga alba]